VAFEGNVDCLLAGNVSFPMQDEKEERKKPGTNLTFVKSFTHQPDPTTNGLETENTMIAPDVIIPSESMTWIITHVGARQ